MFGIDADYNITGKRPEIRYIKLGPNNRWAKDALRRGEIPFSFREVPHDLALTGDEDRITAHLAGQGKAQGADRDLHAHSETGTGCDFGAANVSRFRYAQEAESISSPQLQISSCPTPRAHSKTGTFLGLGTAIVCRFRYAQEAKSNFFPVSGNEGILRNARMAKPEHSPGDGAVS